MGGLFAKTQHIERKFLWLSQYVDFDNNMTELQGLVDREKDYIFGAVMYSDAPTKRHQAVLFHEKGSKEIQLAGLPVAFPEEIPWQDFQENEKYEALRNATGLTKEKRKDKENLIKKNKKKLEKTCTHIVVYVLVKVNFNIKGRFKGRQFGYDSPTVSELAQFYEAVGMKLNVENETLKNTSIEELLNVLNAKQWNEEKSRVIASPGPKTKKADDEVAQTKAEQEDNSGGD